MGPAARTRYFILGERAPNKRPDINFQHTVSSRYICFLSSTLLLKFSLMQLMPGSEFNAENELIISAI